MDGSGFEAESDSCEAAVCQRRGCAIPPIGTAAAPRQEARSQEGVSRDRGEVEGARQDGRGERRVRQAHAALC